MVLSINKDAAGVDVAFALSGAFGGLGKSRQQSAVRLQRRVVGVIHHIIHDYVDLKKKPRILIALSQIKLI